MVVAAVAEWAVVVAFLPAFQLDSFRTILKVVGRVARSNEFVPAMRTRLCRDVKACDTHAMQLCRWKAMCFFRCLGDGVGMYDCGSVACCGGRPRYVGVEVGKLCSDDASRPVV